MTYPHSPRPGPPQRAADQWAADQRDADQRAGRVTGEPIAAAAGLAETGHPAVDAVLRSLANAARLAPADQIAEYKAAHRVLQETLSSIDG